MDKHPTAEHRPDRDCFFTHCTVHNNPAGITSTFFCHAFLTSNLDQRSQPFEEWQSNAHLDITNLAVSR